MKVEKTETGVVVSMTVEEARVMRQSASLVQTLMYQVDESFLKRYEQRTGYSVDAIETLAFRLGAEINSSLASFTS